MSDPVPDPSRTFVVAAVALRDGRDRVLTVRKRGTSAFMLPGGKIEAGETPAAAARRELREEVGLDSAVLSPLARYDAPAANEAGWRVDAWVFTAERPVAAASVAAGAEIAEVRWADPWQLAEWPEDEVAPLLWHVLVDLTPDLAAGLPLLAERYGRRRVRRWGELGDGLGDGLGEGAGSVRGWSGTSSTSERST